VTFEFGVQKSIFTDTATQSLSPLQADCSVSVNAGHNGAISQPDD